MIRTRYVAVLSFIFTIVFFVEYTSLHKRVHIPSDLEGFHYPLFDYAFQALHHGRFPQWDPTIYSGLSFAGNTQAALFYPPTWVAFAFHWRRPKLRYQAVEYLDLAQVWLAFLLCYVWLRHQRGLHPLAAALGGGIFAFSGFMLEQLQHFGLVAGYAWTPLGWAGIDAVDQQRSWRPVWRTVVASAMCFLAGYPSTWAVFSVCMLVYACARQGGIRRGLLVTGALLASLVVAAVQVLPAWEGAQFMHKEPKYGRASGIRDPAFFISYVVPNYYDFGLNVPIDANPSQDYLYLGAAALVGLALIPARKRFKDTAPPLAVMLVSLLFIVNPFELLGRVIERVDFLSNVFSGYYFLAGVTASIALLAALGIDYGLRRNGRTTPGWLPAIVITASVAWSIRLIVVWSGEGKELAVKWLSGVDALLAAILFGLLILLFPGASRPFRFAAAIAAVLLMAAEFKAFGTSNRLNAARGPFYPDYLSEPFPGLNATVYQTLRRHPEFRLALDPTAPYSVALRHVDLTTPQGLDPFLPEQYRTLMDRIARFDNNREFTLQPENLDALRLLGVRYFMTSRSGPLFPKLVSNPHFELLKPANSYYQVFEYAEAQPPFGWEDDGPSNAIELRAWQPEQRAFAVNAGSGSRFRLTEQFYPGWTATIDGRLTPIERCHEAFQCVAVAAGTHLVEFRYRSRFLVAGGLISLCSILLLAGLIIRPNRSVILKV